MLSSLVLTFSEKFLRKNHHDTSHYRPGGNYLRHFGGLGHSIFKIPEDKLSRGAGGTPAYAVPSPDTKDHTLHQMQRFFVYATHSGSYTPAVGKYVKPSG